MSTAANPRADHVHPSDAAQESTGAVASDSLAAESIKAGEGFSENDNAAISGVKGANSTLNTTDTSGASVLPAARDGAQRAQKQAKGLGSDERGTTGATLDTLGQAEFSGTHSSEGYAGGPTETGVSSSTTSGGNLPSGATGDSFADGSAPSSTGGVSSGSSAIKSSSGSLGGGQTTTSSSSSYSGGGSSAGTAPNYAATVSGALRPEGEDQPKGKDLTEGTIPETKTFTGDVGGVHDPGRLATKDFTKVGPGNAASSGATGGQSGDSGAEFTGGQYDVLSSERA